MPKDEGESYVVRGARMECEFGSHGRKINLLKSHGSYVNDKPMMNKGDRKLEENICYFGVCESPDNPNSETIYLIKENGQPISGKRCCPIFIDDWYDTKEETMVEGESALTTKSKLVCKYKGKITFETDGQQEE